MSQTIAPEGSPIDCVTPTQGNGPMSTLSPSADRRRAPRVPVDAMVTIADDDRTWSARTVNASERGLLVAVSDVSGIVAGGAMQLRLDLGGALVDVPAEVVRVETVRGWVAFRFTGDPARVRTGGPRRRIRKSRARPRAPRPRVQVRAELRSLSALVYEQALMDADAQPVDTLLTWADGLAGELGVEGVGLPPHNRALLHLMVRISQDADRALEA